MKKANPTKYGATPEVLSGFQQLSCHLELNQKCWIIFPDVTYNYAPNSLRSPTEHLLHKFLLFGTSNKILSQSITNFCNERPYHIMVWGGQIRDILSILDSFSNKWLTELIHEIHSGLIITGCVLTLSLVSPYENKFLFACILQNRFKSKHLQELNWKVTWRSLNKG